MYKKYLKYFDYPRDIQELLSKIKNVVPQLKFPIRYWWAILSENIFILILYLLGENPSDAVLS